MAAPMRHAPLLYPSPDAWTRARHKRVALFGMSGLGKTTLAALLREAGGWFHYSVDYRIGTRYMGEFITDSFLREAMKVPTLAPLLLSDSIYIRSNITFDNLAPLSTYVGKPGDPALGGLPIAEYRRRQAEHEAAEIAALRDAPRTSMTIRISSATPAARSARWSRPRIPTTPSCARSPARCCSSGSRTRPTTATN